MTMSVDMARDPLAVAGERAPLRRVLAMGWGYRWWFLASLGTSAIAAAVFGFMLVAIDRLVRAWSAVQSALDAGGDGPSAQVLIEARATTDVIALQMLALVPLAALSAWAALLVSQRLANGVMRDLRLRFVGHLVDLDLGFHAQAAKGDLMARMMADLAGVRTMIQKLFSRVAQRPIELAVYVGYVLYLDRFLGTVFAVALLPLGLALLRITGRTRRRARKSRLALSHSLIAYEQITSGIRVIKAMGSAERERQRFSGANQEFYRRQMRVARVKAQSEAITHGAIFLMLAGLLGLGGWLFARGLTEPATLIMALVALARSTTVLRELQRGINDLFEHLPAAERVFAVLDRRPTLDDDPSLPACPPPAVAIRLEGVRFRYAPDDEEVLRGIDLEIPIGSTVALVGPSGGGKSTLLDLLPRLHDVTAGRICWDGVDLREFRPATIIGHCAIVQQDPFLFDDTVFENIRYGRPEASIAEVEQAARRAHVHDDILALEGGLGYQTRVGDRGSRLSGGQRQRVAIARALLRDAPVLLMDEPTSALDAGSETHVQAALDELMRGRTTVVVAHRLATVRHANCIHVLGGKDDADQRGRIIESGAHHELIAQGGVYASLVAQQSLSPDPL